MERDYISSQRATKSLTKSLESHTSSDAEYYKRKTSEQNGRIQSLNAVLAEKNRQIDELRHQIQRSMSQNKWASIGTERSDRKRTM